MPSKKQLEKLEAIPSRIVFASRQNYFYGLDCKYTFILANTNGIKNILRDLKIFLLKTFFFHDDVVMYLLMVSFIILIYCIDRKV